jgi:glycosyltransferase involved in cell wall biosynthesis
MTQIGLLGYNTAQGLGYLCRDFVRHVPVRKWLIPKHRRFPTLEPVIESNRFDVVIRSKISDATIQKWVDRIDVLLFFESPIIDRVVEIAHARGKKVACVSMHESLPAKKKWLGLVDLWLAPTLHTVVALRERNVRGSIRYFPWPVDTDRFVFQQRNRCSQFVYAQGNGGPLDRKGAVIVRQALRIDPELPISIYSQVQDEITPDKYIPVDWSGCDFRGSVEDPTEIYQSGDVFLMPSRWEGLGLPLYECQATGMPLICTDAAPMNESNPWQRLACTSGEALLLQDRRVTSWNVDANHLVGVLRSVLGCDIYAASQSARQFAESRSWKLSAEKLHSLLSEK